MSQTNHTEIQGVKGVVDRAFSVENNSAAALDKEKLGKYNRIAVKMFHNTILTPKEMLLPTIGDFGEKMLSALNGYSTLYYVNVLKIDMTYVTLILTLIGIYDVLNNPLMGIAYDRTRTRWGKARPWIVFGAFPYYLSSFILFSGAMFLGERPGNDPKKIIFVFIMLFLRETFSTIYAMPRTNILTLQTANPRDRIVVGAMQNTLGSIGSQAVYFVFIRLVEASNKGWLDISMSFVYMLTAAIVTVVGTAGNITMAVKCQERILLQPKPADITKTAFYILKNKYALRNFIASFATSWWSSGGYSWDIVTQQEIFGGSNQTLLAYLPHDIVSPLSNAFIPKFIKLFKGNNRNAVLTLRIWDIITSVSLIAVGWNFVDNRLAICIIYAIFAFIEGFNNAPATVFEAELNREINDYTEYVTGERPDGTIGLLTGLITKITAPLNALFTVKLFKWSGYDTTIPMVPWGQGSKAVYQKVFFLFEGIKQFPFFVACIPYFFYDLVGEKKEKMYVELNERRALLAKEHERNEELEALAEVLEAEMSET